MTNKRVFQVRNRVFGWIILFRLFHVIICREYDLLQLKWKFHLTYYFERNIISCCVEDKVEEG